METEREQGKESAIEKALGNIPSYLDWQDKNYSGY